MRTVGNAGAALGVVHSAGRLRKPTGDVPVLHRLAHARRPLVCPNGTGDGSHVGRWGSLWATRSTGPWATDRRPRGGMHRTRSASTGGWQYGGGSFTLRNEGNHPETGKW